MGEQVFSFRAHSHPPLALSLLRPCAAGAAPHLLQSPGFPELLLRLFHPGSPGLGVRRDGSSYTCHGGDTVTVTTCWLRGGHGWFGAASLLQAPAPLSKGHWVRCGRCGTRPWPLSPSVHPSVRLFIHAGPCVPSESVFPLFKQSLFHTRCQSLPACSRSIFSCL